MNTAIKKKKGIKNVLMSGFMMLMAMCMTISVACADPVTVEDTDVDSEGLMGKIIGILLSITRYVGIALIIYGVYEIVMSFMQQQPEAKTKGIVMALAGAVMVALKSVLQGIGVVA